MRRVGQVDLRLVTPAAADVACDPNIQALRGGGLQCGEDTAGWNQGGFWKVCGKHTTGS